MSPRTTRAGRLPGAIRPPSGRQAVTPKQVLVIFDFDNTLVRSRIDFAGMKRAMVRYLASHGVPGALKAARRLAAPEILEMAREHDRRPYPGPGRPGASSASPPDPLEPSLWEIVTAFEARGMEGAVPEPSAPAVMAELRRRGFWLAVLTNNARDVTRRVLEEHHLADFFHRIAGREDVPRLKPAGDGVAHLLEAFPQVRRAFLVGDSWVDGEAAARGGARFIAVGAGGGRTCRVSPWRRVSSLEQVLALDLLQDRPPGAPG